MGSPEGEAGRWDYEGPQYEVELTRGFWLAATACTQQQWQAVMRSNPSGHQGRDRPVVNVTWEECRQYCTHLNRRFPELGMRLPTEAEWEYACRAGTTSAFSDGSPCTRPTGVDPALEALGWYGKNSGNQTHPVAQKAANAWGLFDMHANVREWCADWWQGAYEGAGAVNPTGPTDGRDRVIRGGSIWNFARSCRSACRSRGHPGDRHSNQGFRPAAGQPVSKEPPEGVQKERAKEPSIGGKEGGTTDSRRARRRRPGRLKKEKKGR
ncbi:MAG: formylglycine-generating enzyme family protein [bacterium]|nr:formylglycine-generating enzyme family protein [bacterium]